MNLLLLWKKLKILYNSCIVSSLSINNIPHFNLQLKLFLYDKKKGI